MWRSTAAITLILALSILAMVPWAEAQLPGKKIPRIGYLQDTSPAVDPYRHEAFLQGLRALGWVEGQNLVIEYRYAHGQDARLPALAAELVHLQVDVLVARIAPAVRAVMQATSTIPIVMAHGGHDPVEAGFVASLAHPGGNVTGVSMGIGVQFAEKWVELLKEAAPQVSRVAVLWDPTRPAMRAILTATERAARALGLQGQLLEARDLAAVEQALVAMKREEADALIMLPSILFGREHRPGSAFMAQTRLPAIYWDRKFAEAGGLMAYGPNVRALMRRAAYYVDRILKGTKPADLPVEEPTQFELVINLKTAKALGMTLPPSLLLLADEVLQ
jgi:putative ABC transport system substrate-binding protein